jgi:thiol-disulfide isomerase/thioredoxin
MSEIAPRVTDESPASSEKSLNAVAVAILLAGLFGAFAFVPRFMSDRGSGQDAPDVSAPLVANAAANERTFKISDHKGSPILIDFWATWCGPCRAEAPIIDRMSQRYKDRGLVVVGMNTSDEAGMAESWVKANHISFPIAYDDGNRAARAFGVDSLPTLVVISKSGKIAAIRQGVTSDDDLDRIIRSAL